MRVSSRRFAVLGSVVLCAFGVAASASAEIFVGSGNAIIVFADDANGEVEPLRTISGPLTELPSVFTLMLDRVHREIWVSGCLGSTSILVFSMDDVNEVPPLRKISGASTGLVNACSTLLDLLHDELYVIDAAGAVRVFPRLADGDVAPTRTISGALASLNQPAMGYLDLVNDELYVVNFSNGIPAVPRVRVFARAADGNVAPIRTLGLTGSGISNPRGLLVDLEQDELIVINLGDDAVRFYARTASGADSWLREIQGVATLLDAPHQVVLTEGDEMLIGNEGGLDANFIGHARTAVDNATPIRYVAGPATSLTSPTGIATDRAKNCSEGNSVDGCIFRDNFEAADSCYWSSSIGTPACV